MNDPASDFSGRPEGFQRVAQALRAVGHDRPPMWLEVAARTSAEAADALGVQVGQIAKSIVFRRAEDDAVVLVVAAGDKRVDEHKVAAIVGPLKRADATFVKEGTGFSIGGVSPFGHAVPEDRSLVMLIDEALFRFDVVWAAAGHPNGVFPMAPDDLHRYTGAPVADVAQP